MSDQEPGGWRLNYFNYFTEVEEHFQKARGTSLFLLSPMDWALLESWKNSGVPLEAVLRGIDAAFEKWRTRKIKTQMVNSLAFCTQAILKEAETAAAAVAGRPPEEPPIPEEAVRRHLERGLAALRATSGWEEAAQSVEAVLAAMGEHFQNLQDLDLRLTAIEDRIAAQARTRLTDEDLLSMRRELESQLRPYRGKMPVEQLARLEKTFLDRRVFEHFGLPRLSLYYLSI
jgi:hypothetical protein